jgi:preprotein translocase subunit SecB
MAESPSTTVPLQLEDFFLTRLNVEWRNLPSEGDYKVNSLKVQVSYELAHHAELQHAYQMTLSVAGEDVIEKAANAGYKFEAVITGRYHIENAKTPELEARLAVINGISLLYSTLRGLLGSVTGSFEFGKLVLPSINPLAIVEQAEKAKLMGGKSDSAPPLPVVKKPAATPA